ncbi:bactofilin family protein [Paenibacillus validus]|uniref:bactofilin family protein n=2 Tax=Paenibacillus validus TaxID=44253 RepID=UPI000FD82517|nr:polymer-forming cytoskeletal protein [Paenibacillus validus]MED4609686.1 polymer-forming cytoskeletal protein [Paenibacillus validus]
MIGLFGKPSNRSRGNGAVTLISEGSRMEGVITSQADLRIEGEFIGTLHANGEVAIGEKGAVSCKELRTQDLIVAGRLDGSVHAEGIVRITSTGKLTGRIAAGQLIVEKGAVFEGLSAMTGLEEAPAETGSGAAASDGPIRLAGGSEAG